MLTSKTNLPVKAGIILLILSLGVFSQCQSYNDNDPAGEWRLSAARREAVFGGRADRIRLSEEAVYPVYYNLENNGEFRAESSRFSVNGTWKYNIADNQIILSGQDKRTDTLRVISLNGRLRLENTHYTREGIIVLTFDKEM